MSAATASPKKGQAKKKVAAKKPADHPKYIEMISAAITALKERNGSSRQAITKFVKANYKVGDSCESHLKLALKRGVASGALLQPKGTGASGSFKVKKVESKKKPAKKPATKKAAAPKKKTAVAKKPTAKKTTPKKTAAKKKPATKKTPVKKATPKKAVKKVGGKKKTPAKKTKTSKK